MPKYKLQEMPDIQKKGEKRVFPKVVSYRQLDTKEFLDGMYAHNHAVPQSAAAAVLTDVAQYLAEVLSQGYTVRLDGIGHFSLALDFDDDKPRNMSGENDKMTHRKVAVRDVNISAAPEMVKYLRMNTELTRDAEGVSRLRKQIYTEEERIARALEWLESHASMTLGDYAKLNNMTKPTASRELKMLAEKEECPFEAVGSGSHRAWVKKGAK